MGKKPGRQNKAGTEKSVPAFFMVETQGNGVCRYRTSLFLPMGIVSLLIIAAGLPNFPSNHWLASGLFQHRPKAHHKTARPPNIPSAVRMGSGTTVTSKEYGLLELALYSILPF
jgi:hypothetical protein